MIISLYLDFLRRKMIQRRKAPSKSEFLVDVSMNAALQALLTSVNLREPLYFEVTIYNICRCHESRFFVYLFFKLSVLKTLGLVCSVGGS